MKERWDDLVSITCLAGIRSATSQRKTESHAFPGQLGRYSLPVRRSAPQRVVLRSAGRLSKKSLPIFDTHWLAVSRFIVILASGHGSGKVDKQCNSSDVAVQTGIWVHPGTFAACGMFFGGLINLDLWAVLTCCPPCWFRIAFVRCLWLFSCVSRGSYSLDRLVGIFMQGRTLQPSKK